MIQVLKWEEFQHYHRRSPPWIKLHRRLLENPKWHALSGDASKLLAECWLLAAESNTGTINMTVAELAWRLRRPGEAMVNTLLQELVRTGFIEISGENASTVLAGRSHDATPETETETEKTIGASVDAPAGGGILAKAKKWPAVPPRANGQYQYPPEFEAAWASYPKRSGSNPKQGAYSAWRSCALKGSDPDALARAAHNYRQAIRESGKEGTEYVQQASTFYGRKGTWADYVDPVTTNGAGPPGGGNRPLTPSERRAFQASMRNESKS